MNFYPAIVTCASVTLLTGCVTMVQKPVIIDPKAVIEAGQGCPGCHGTTLVCAHSEHPKRTLSDAEVSLDQIIIPELAFQQCQVSNACIILSEQTGVPVILALTNQASLKPLTITSEGRDVSLLFILEWMALKQNCRLRLTKHSAELID